MARRTTVRTPRAGAPQHRPAGDPLERATLELQDEIEALVAKRQALRSAGADRAALEANRLELGRLQRQLSYAALGRPLAA